MCNKNLFGDDDWPVTFYDWSRLREYVKGLDMPFDEDFAKRIDNLAFELKLMPDQLFPLGVEHAWRVKCMFTPANYDWKSRFLIALKFLNPFGSK